MTSPKPVSSSRPRLNRTLRRRAKQRPIEERDWPYLYAAARMGAFDLAFSRAGHRPEGQEQIRAFLTDLFLVGDTRVLVAKTKRGRIPVGVIVAGFDGIVLEPHATWFPWAKPRNKIETILRYLADRRNDATLLIKSEIEFKEFWELMARYGVLRRVGTVLRPPDAPLTLWQSWISRKDSSVANR